MLLRGRERSVDYPISALRVINEHVEHVTVSPIRDGLPALALDRAVYRVYAVKRALRRLLRYEDNLLCVADCGEKSSDGVTGKFTGEEEPIAGPVERELRCRACKDKQYEVGVAPDG